MLLSFPNSIQQHSHERCAACYKLSCVPLSLLTQTHKAVHAHICKYTCLCLNLLFRPAHARAHGPQEIRELYGREVVNLRNEGRWVFLNTLFSVSEAVMYMQVGAWACVGVWVGGGWGAWVCFGRTVLK